MKRTHKNSLPLYIRLLEKLLPPGWKIAPISKGYRKPPKGPTAQMVGEVTRDEKAELARQDVKI